MAQDYISALDGGQMDTALMDMAEHTSEAWAVGERNGNPVSSTDPTYENNAKYYSEHAREVAVGMESKVVPSLPATGENDIRYLIATGIQDVYDVYIWQASTSDYLSLGQTSMTSQGDMLKSVYDADDEVANAGGITNYVLANASAKATSLDITLASEDWANNEQTISNAFFVATGYLFTIAIDDASYDEYGECGVRALEVTTDGEITFKCNNAPTSDLTLTIYRSEVAV